MPMQDPTKIGRPSTETFPIRIKSALQENLTSSNMISMYSQSTRQSGRPVCFLNSIPCVKRPRSEQLLSVNSQRYFGSTSHFRKLRQRCSLQPRMTTSDSLTNPNPGNSDLTNSQSILPQGAFTVILKVKLRPELSITDRKVLLSEYARKTCGEPKVLRCDVLYEVTAVGMAKNSYYTIWIVFINSRGYLEHEKTPHATKLRVCLESPSGGDSSKMLTKLAHQVSIVRPIQPDPESWRSCLDFSVYEGNQSNRISYNSAAQLPSNGESTKSQADIVRKSLDALISSVGLENVVILVAKAKAKSMDDMRILKDICKSYVQELEKSPGTVRTGILVESQHSNTILVLTVHDGNHEDGACFDMELGDDHIVDDGWQVSRNYAVFPDKIGWEKRVEVLDDIQPSDSQNFLVADPEPETDTQPAQLMPKTTGTPATSDVKCRLVHGPEAFNKLKQYCRQMCRKPVEDIQVLIVCGWNQARTARVLFQLDNDLKDDPGIFRFAFCPTVYSSDLTTNSLKQCLESIDRVRPDVIIAYGGGTVMDMAKVLGRMGNCSAEDRDRYMNTIDGSVVEDDYLIDVEINDPPMPVILVPCIVGCGAAVTELTVFNAKKGKKQNRLAVRFTAAPTTVRNETEKTILFDSRIVNPKRLFGYIASQGAIELVCFGVDALLCREEQNSTDVETFAVKGITPAFENITSALREPSHASGQSRDPLFSSQLAVGLASDAVGRLGPCVVLTLAILDSLVDGRAPLLFRQILIRTTAAVLKEISESELRETALPFWKTIRGAIKIPNNESFSRILLERAEDANVPLLRQTGFVRRNVESVVARVSSKGASMSKSALEKEFYNVERLRKILLSAYEQEYEL